MNDSAEIKGADDEPPKRKLSGSQSRVLIGLFVALVAAGVVFYVVEKRKAHREKLERTHQIAELAIAEAEEKLESVEPLSAAEKSQLRTYRNKDHIAAAERLGIDGLESAQEAKQLTRKDELVKISEGAYYTIQDLDYSVPYLVPSGSVLLDEIGEHFHERLADLGLPPFQFVVTSVTRTEAHQKALRRVNVNAAVESSHEYGTTFDLHYGKFAFTGQPAIPDSANIYEDVLAEDLSAGYERLSAEYDAALKALLGRALIELQEDGTALTIYERRQPVFHVTVAEELSQQDTAAVTASSRK